MTGKAFKIHVFVDLGQGGVALGVLSGLPEFRLSGMAALADTESDQIFLLGVFASGFCLPPLLFSLAIHLDDPFVHLSEGLFHFLIIGQILLQGDKAVLELIGHELLGLCRCHCLFPG